MSVDSGGFVPRDGERMQEAQGLNPETLVTKFRLTLADLLLFSESLMNKNLTPSDTKKILAELEQLKERLVSSAAPFLPEEVLAPLRANFFCLADSTANLVTADNRTPVLESALHVNKDSANHLRLGRAALQKTPVLSQELAGATLLSMTEFRRYFAVIIRRIQDGGIYVLRKNNRLQAVLRRRSKKTATEVVARLHFQRSPGGIVEKVSRGNLIEIEGTGVEIGPPPSGAIREPSPDELKESKRERERQRYRNRKAKEAKTS